MHFCETLLLLKGVSILPYGYWLKFWVPNRPHNMGDNAYSNHCWAVVSQVAFKNFTWVVLIKVKWQPPESLYKWFENWERFTQSEPIMLAFILVRGRIHLAYHRWHSKTSHWHQIRHTSSLSCFKNSSFRLCQQGCFRLFSIIYSYTYICAHIMYLYIHAFFVVPHKNKYEDFNKTQG